MIKIYEINSEHIKKHHLGGPGSPESIAFEQKVEILRELAERRYEKGKMLTDTQIEKSKVLEALMKKHRVSMPDLFKHGVLNATLKDEPKFIPL